MRDIECPYCGKEIEINHDDGYGYEEDRIHNQECGKCGKTFVYTTSIWYYYEAEKVPCLNDGEHDWKVNTGYPSGYLSNWHTCKCCGEREIINNALIYGGDKDVWIKKDSPC